MAKLQAPRNQCGTTIGTRRQPAYASTRTGESPNRNIGLGPEHDWSSHAADSLWISCHRLLGAGKVSHQGEVVTGLRSYRLIKHPLLAFQLKNVKGYPVLNVKVIFPNIIQRPGRLLRSFHATIMPPHSRSPLFYRARIP
jgi:hypothetical protein